MKAKDYLRDNKNSMYHFDTVNRIVNELYPLRHDKEATTIYYDRILIADIRFFEWESNHYEWQNLHKLYGASYMEPIFVQYENEVDKEDANNVRHELLRVVKNDISFGYITSLLDSHIKEPTQSIIDQAISEELSGEQKQGSEIGRHTTSTQKDKDFRDYFINNNSDKYLSFIEHQLKGIKGREVAIVIRALNEANIITLKGGNNGVYQAIRNYFDIDIGSNAGINKYLSGSEKDSILKEVERMKQALLQI